mgnify:CR=1 FL=1
MSCRQRCRSGNGREVALDGNVASKVLSKRDGMRKIGALVCVVAATLMLWGTSSVPARALTSQESAANRAGSFYYCAWTMTMGSPPCGSCSPSIFHDYSTGSDITLYYKCPGVSGNAVCWQTSFASSPNPTCGLNATPCTGNITLFWDPNCYTSHWYDPQQACSSIYPSGQVVGVAGMATGVNCNGMPSAVYTTP